MQQLVFQLVHSHDDRAHGPAQSFGRRLKAALYDFDHIPDFIHEQADRAVFRAHHDVHALFIARAGRKLQASPEVDRSHDLPA